MEDVSLAELPECLAAAEPGPFNQAGDLPGATETSSDWTWAAPVESMQWDLMVERDVAARDGGAGAVSGYYWHQQFSFEQGVAGRLGIQTEGVYQTDPPDSPVEFTKIAVLWLSGPPLAAELGDIPYPDARVAATTAAGTDWLTIHARLDWQVCVTYRLSFGPQSNDADGNVWYGAWIEDTDTGERTLLGRMLLPSDAGLLSPFSTFRTSPFEFGEISCQTVQPVSAVFGRLISGDGNQAAELAGNRFTSPARCASSRFTPFPNAVRHELGVAN